MEVKPAVAATTDFFMHMIAVGDESLSSLPKTKTFEDGTSMGVEFKYEGNKYRLVFDKTADYGCKITVNGK